MHWGYKASRALRYVQAESPSGFQDRLGMNWGSREAAVGWEAHEQSSGVGPYRQMAPKADLPKGLGLWAVNLPTVLFS